MTTTTIEAALFAICCFVFVGPVLLACRWVCGTVGAFGNFALNRAWAFGAVGQRARAQFKRYIVVALAAVTMASGLWWLMRFALGWDPRVLHLMSMALVWTGFTFPLLSRWVFAR